MANKRKKLNQKGSVGTASSSISNDSLVSISQASKILGVSLDTIRRWDKNGTLKSQRPDGKNRFFKIDDIEAIKFSEPLSIGEAAEQLNMSPSTLRRLETKGMIKPDRNEKGERVYDRESLQSFIRSDYFLRQKEVEAEILEPLEHDKEPFDIDDKENKHKGHDPLAHALLGEHNQSLQNLHKFRDLVVKTAKVLVASFLIIVAILTILFLLFPEGSAKNLGYYKYNPTTKKFVYQPPDSLLARQLRPFSETALRVVEVVNTEKRQQIAPFDPIDDVNDIFKPDQDGNISSIYSFTVPDTSYLVIPDQGLVENLNSDYLRGYKPGTEDGDLAILPISGGQISDGTLTGLDIKDGSITEADLAPGLSFGGSTFINTPGGTVQTGVRTIIAGIGLNGGGNGEVITLNVGAGAGITGLSGALEVDVTTNGTTGLDASNSGLEVGSDGLRLLGGCSDGQVLAWSNAAAQWQCTTNLGGGGGASRVEEGDVLVSGTVITLDFSASGFSVNQSPVGEVNIDIDYANSGITRRNQAETIASNWTFNGGLSCVDCIALGSETTGNFVAGASSSSAGLIVSGSGAENANLVLDLDVTTTGATLSTASNSGLEIGSDGLRLIGGCASGQVLKWNGGAWACSADNSGGTAGDAFTQIDSDSGTSPVADSATDVLTLVGGGGLVTTGNAITDRVTFDIGAGDGITVLTDTVTIDALTTGTTLTTSSNSGLEVTADGLRLLGGCANNQILKWNGSTWACAVDGGGTGTFSVEEGDVVASAATTTLDFLAGDFTITETPVGEANIAIDYANSNITRSNQTHTITSSWTFSGGLDCASCITLGSETFGDYVQAVSSGTSGIVVSGSGGESATPVVSLDTITTGTTATTSSNSGLEQGVDGLRLLGGCATNQILKWNGSAWACATDSSGSGSGSSVWSDLLDPTADLALEHGEFETTFRWNANNTTSSNLDGLTLEYVNDGVSDPNTQRLLVLKNQDNGINDLGNIKTEAALRIEHNDDSTLDKGIEIIGSVSPGGFINTALDVSDGNIRDALDVGANNIVGTTADIEFDNLDFNGSFGILELGGLSYYTGDGDTTYASGGGGSLLFDSSSGEIIVANTDVLTLGSGSATGHTYSSITNAGGAANGGDVTDDNDLYIQGALEVDGNFNLGGNVTILGTTINALNATAFNCSDCIDYDDLENTLNVDESTNTFLANNDLTSTLDGTGDFRFDLTGSGDLEVRDGATTFAQFADSGAITFTPTAGQNFTVVQNAGVSSRFIAGNALTTDLVQFSNSGFGTAVSGVDGLQVDFATSPTTGSQQNAGIALNISSGATSVGDTLQGIDISALSGGGGLESALRIGAGWDRDIDFSDTTPVITFANGASSNLTFQDSAGVASLIVRDLDAAANHVLFGDANTGLELSGATIDLQSTSGEELRIESGGNGTLTIAGDSGNETVAIATGSGAKTLTLGSTTSTSSTTIQAGSGGTLLQSTTGDVVVNLTGTRDFRVEDNGTTFVTFSNTGSTTFTQQGSSRVRIDATSTPSTTTSGVLALDVASTTANNRGYVLNYQSSNGAGTGDSLYAQVINLQQNDADSRVFGLSVNSLGTSIANSGGIQCLICLENQENQNGFVQDGLRIDSTSGIEGSITNGINFTSTDIGIDINLQNGETIDNNTDGLVLITAPTTQASGIFLVGDGLGNDYLSFTEEGTNPACGLGEFKIWANSAENLLKKCQNGALSDLDAAGAWNQITPPTDNLLLNHQEFTTEFEFNTGPTAAQRNYWTFSTTNDATVDGNVQNLVVIANNDDGTASGSPESLLFVTNDDINELVDDGIIVTSASGGITDAIDASGAAIVNALNVGANDITGTDWRILATSDVAEALSFSSQGGVGFDIAGTAGQDFRVTNTGGSVALTSTESVSDALRFNATNGGFDIDALLSSSLSLSGNNADLTLESLGLNGDINLNANSGSGAVRISATGATGGLSFTGGNSGIVSNTTGSFGVGAVASTFDLSGTNANALRVTTSNTAGGATFNLGSGGATFNQASGGNFVVANTDGSISLTANGATNGDVAVSAGDRVDINAVNAIRVNSTSGGLDVDTVLDMIFTTSSGNILLDNSSGAGDVVVETDADSNFQINAVAQGVDVAAINNTSAGATTDGVDGLQIDFLQNAAIGERQNPALRINVTSGSSEAFDNVEAIFIDDLTSASAGSETAIRIGANWDTGLAIGLSDADFDSGVARRDIDVVGSWGGNAYSETNTFSGTPAVDTITAEALAYELNAPCTANSTGAYVYDITGLPNTDGTVAHIFTHTFVSDTADIGTETCAVTVRVNGDDVNTNNVAADGVTTTSQNGYESFTAVRISGNWRAIGIDSPNPESTGTDLAEWTRYSGDLPQPGDLVSIDPSRSATVMKSNGIDDKNIIGIVATLPGITLGEDDGQSVQLALAGRVPVKVSDENGEVFAGDYLTSSSIPGVAMKATSPGAYVGKAFENHDGSGVVMTFIENGWYGGDFTEMMAKDIASKKVQTDSIESLSGQGVVLSLQQDEQFSIVDHEGNLRIAFSDTGEALFGAVNTEKIISNEIGQRFYARSSALEIGDVVSVDAALPAGIQKSQAAYDAKLVGVVSGSPSLLFGDTENAGYEFVVATIGNIAVKVTDEAGAIKAGDPLTSSSTPGYAMKATKAGPIIGYAMHDFNGTGTVLTRVGGGYSSGDVTKQSEEIDGRVVVLEGEVSGLRKSQELIDSVTDANNDGLSDSDIDWQNVEVGNLVVSLDAVIEGSLSVRGNTEFFGTAAFRGVSNFFEQTFFAGDVFFAENPIFNNDTAGFAIIEPGATTVDVVFTKDLPTVPSVLLTLGEGPFVQYKYQNLTTKGFQIVIESPQTETVMISWSTVLSSNTNYFSNAPR